jgi:hypothetical protein
MFHQIKVPSSKYFAPAEITLYFYFLTLFIKKSKLGKLIIVEAF